MTRRSRHFAGFSPVIVIAITAILISGCGEQTEPSAAPSVSPESATLFSDFTGTPDGPAPSTFDSGQPARIADVADSSMTLHIVDGRLTFAPRKTGPAAGYLVTPDLGRPILLAGMEWKTSPGTGDDPGPGVAALGIGDRQANPLIGQPPRLSCHLIVRKDGWSYGVSPGTMTKGSMTLFPIAGGQFSPPLRDDGTTTYRAQVQIKGDSVHLELPDGSAHDFSDPRVAAWSGRYAFFEAFAQNGRDDGRVGITRVWADT